MTAALELLSQVAARGVELAVEDSRLRLRGPSAALPADVVEQLRDYRDELIALLRDGRRSAAEAWAQAVSEMSQRWHEVRARRGVGSWLEESRDLALQELVGEAIRRGDLVGTVVAIARWREAWEVALAGVTPMRRESSPEMLAMADELIAESEGRRPPPNPSVRAMICAFEARLVRNRGPPASPCDPEHAFPTKNTGSTSKGETMPIDLQDFMGGKYLQKDDVPQPLIVTIKHVVEQHFEGEGRKLIIYFEELAKGLVANKTNLRLAVELLRTKDVEAWRGRKLTLYSDPEVKYEGRRTGGLRFRAPPVADEETPF